MSRERPILFSAPMVREILEGRKTQTRRVVKLQPRTRGDIGHHGIGLPFIRNPDPLRPNHTCPYGQPGGRLWVRETWAHVPASAYQCSDGVQQTVCPSDPDMAAVYAAGWDRSMPGRWRPSIHMPRWASRIDLEVTGVRVERLQDISEEDVIAEGCPDAILYGTGWYRALWESINGPDSWTANPWVWVVEFKRN